jgi:hypothetical protein
MNSSNRSGVVSTFATDFVAPASAAARVRVPRYGLEKARIGIAGIPESERIFLISSGQAEVENRKIDSRILEELQCSVEGGSELNLESLRLEFLPEALTDWLIIIEEQNRFLSSRRENSFHRL